MMPSYRKSARRRARPLPVSKPLLFWGAFFVIIALLFAVNAPKITAVWHRVFADKAETAAPDSPGSTEAAPQTGQDSPPLPQGIPSVRIAEPNRAGADDDGGTETFWTPPGAPGAAAGNAAGITETPPAGNGMQAAGYGTPPAGNGTQAAGYGTQAGGNGTQADAEEYRERTVYMARVDNSGMVFLAAVKRKTPVNDTPLISTLNLLLQGPSAGEKGLITLIPPGTRVIGAAVERNTAVINFNDNFMFNTYGAEGYLAQLKQIVWTATEFPNIHDVEFRIDGRKTAYLGETIRLDRPRSRDSF